MLTKIHQNVQATGKVLSVFMVCLFLAACETGHLWSLYSLGFTKRDAYLDNLADARDSLQQVVQQLQPLSSEDVLDKPQRKSMKSADETLERFAKQLKTTERIGRSWIKAWQSKPQRYITEAFDVGQVASAQDELLIAARSLAAALHKQIKKPKRVDLQVMADQLTAASAWLLAVDRHIEWIEASASGYPIDAIVSVDE